MKKLGKLGVLKKRSEFLFVREGRYKARGGIVVQARENPESTDIRVGFTATNTPNFRTSWDRLRLHRSQFDDNHPI